jgi:SSS family solute:Na+ symporter
MVDIDWRISFHRNTHRLQRRGYYEYQGNIGSRIFIVNQCQWYQILNWSITIIPILVCGNDFCTKEFMPVREKKKEKKAWLIAGFFEWPIMAFMGVILGMLAKVAATNGMFEGITDASSMDSEMGLPILLATILPVGLMGLMLSSYFRLYFHC